MAKKNTTAKVKVKDVIMVTNLLVEMQKYPMKQDNLFTLSDWSDKVSELMEAYTKEYGLTEKLVEAKKAIDEKYQDIETLINKSQTKKLNKAERAIFEKRSAEKKSEVDTATNQVMDAFQESEVELPTVPYLYEENIPAQFNLMMVKNPLVQ